MALNSHERYAHHERASRRAGRAVVLIADKSGPTSGWARSGFLPGDRPTCGRRLVATRALLTDHDDASR